MSQRGIKYILLVGDGMGDYPLDELGGRTPLEVADTPNMDRIAGWRIGLVKTIPTGMPPGSDVANLSLLGYDPKKYHTGRAPFEAASMGVKLGEEDIAFRMNLVTLDFRSDDEIIMVSHSSGDITTEEGKAIVAAVRERIESDGLRIFPGLAYRHLLVWKKGPIGISTIPPHDVLGRNMVEYLRAPENRPISELIQKSWKLLRDHPVNTARRDKGLLEANSIWPWGQGIAPRLPSFEHKFGISGGVISAVDLIKGIGITAGLRPVHVEGATGYLDTNYSGKAEAALEMLEEVDFMFVHVEAPDEAGHSGIVEDKIRAIEAFDKKVVGRVLKGVERFGKYRIMVASDHLTPIPKRTHTDDPTLFAWTTEEGIRQGLKGSFTERAASGSGIYYADGHKLMPEFIYS